MLAVLPGPTQIRSAMPPSRDFPSVFLVVLGLVLGSGLAPGPLSAQESDETGGLVGLVLPLGARNVGQGRATVALPGDVQALPYNPAATASLERGQVAFSRFESADAADVNTNLVAGAAVTSYGAISVQLVYLDYGSIPVTTTSPSSEGSIEANEWALGVGYANRWKRLAYGATAKWYASDLGVVDAAGPAFDLGVVYRPRASLPLDFGVSLRNLGPDLEFESTGELDDSNETADSSGEARLPSRVRVGLAFQADTLLGFGPEYRLTLLFDAESDVRELSTTSVHGGGSLLVHDTVVLRGGFVVADNPFTEREISERNVGGAFGVGIRFGGFEADVAREVSVSELDDETHFSVGYRFQ